jgi:hypothetical protein
MEICRGRDCISRLRQLSDLKVAWGPTIDPIEVTDDGCITSAVQLDAHDKNYVIVDRDDRLVSSLQRWEMVRGNCITTTANGIPWVPKKIYLLLDTDTQPHQENVDAVAGGSDDALVLLV